MLIISILLLLRMSAYANGLGGERVEGKNFTSLEAKGLGRVVRKPVNANPGLNVN